VSYHLASVVDDNELGITHVIRAEEHLSNTPRQVFIIQALGYPLPVYAHLPYVAEPGSHNKLSKRKLDKYLKNKDFANLMDHGRKIAEAIHLATQPDTFNPVIVDFYEQVGYLPDAIINYLALLGWSLDERREEFTREELIQAFSLERVNKAPASFDPQKLWSFQDRYMQRMPVDEKVAMVLPYLARAGLIATPVSNEVKAQVAAIVQAAGDRIKTAGDIVGYNDFFVAEEQLPYDEKAFDKAFGKPGAVEVLSRFYDRLAAAEAFDPASLEALLHAFVEAEGIKIGEIIHPVRVAATGKMVGFGLFDTLAILGKQRSLARITRALKRAKDKGVGA